MSAHSAAIALRAVTPSHWVPSQSLLRSFFQTMLVLFVKEEKKKGFAFFSGEDSGTV